VVCIKKKCGEGYKCKTGGEVEKPEKVNAISPSN
jgi:hypothetical protein